MWEVTARRLEAFLPGLLEQVFPGAGEAKPTPAVEVSREEVEAKMDEKVQEAEEKSEAALPVRETGGEAGNKEERDNGRSEEVVVPAVMEE